jgi:predicted membrane protein
LNRWTVLWIIIVALLLVILVFELVGIVTLEDLIANPILFLIAFVIVAVLSAVGAMFIGVFLTHRIFASEEFTPFEREMLSMREDIRAIRKRLEEVLKALRNPPKGD